MAVFVLSVHADYSCRHSGACCTAGWRIPVEPACEDRLVHSGQAHRLGPDEAPLVEREGMVTVLTLARDGACACFEPATLGRASQCKIHGTLGHDALPSACRHFPRVATTDDSGTYVTLSHFCPTAAAMLFRHDTELAVVEAPASFHSVLEYEGLDARGVLPPLLRPGMLMDLEAHHAWERHAVHVFASDAHTPESALDQLAADARAIAAWQPAEGSLGKRVATLGVESQWSSRPMTIDEYGAASQPRRQSAQLHELVRACVPARLRPEPAPVDLDRTDLEFVEPGWRAFATPIKRYLAAKVFASRVAWQGRGVPTTVTALETARAVLRVEAGRQCARSRRVLDRGLLIEAIRRADLLLVHQASEKALAERLAAVERDDRWAAPARRMGHARRGTRARYETLS